MRVRRSLLRGENGSRSDCANQAKVENVLKRGDRRGDRPAFVFPPGFAFGNCRGTRRKISSGHLRADHSSPEALAAAPCSRAGQMDSKSQNLHQKPGFAGNSPARISAAASWISERTLLSFLSSRVALTA